MIFNTNSGGVTQEQLDSKVSYSYAWSHLERIHKHFKADLESYETSKIIYIECDSNLSLENCMINIYTDKYGFNPISVEETVINTYKSTLKLTFEPHDELVKICIELINPSVFN